MTDPNTILAWHCRRIDGTTLYLATPPPLRRWQRCEGEIIPCENGFHASINPLDAVKYGRGNLLVRVKLRGEVLDDGDKLVARERLDLWRIDATDVLRSFACRCAHDVIHLWNAPDVVRHYLLTGDESLRSAARHSAAGSAAGSAAWAAAWADAWYAALDAAVAAAAEAVGGTEWAAAWTRYNEWLSDMLIAAHEGRDYNAWAEEARKEEEIE